MHSRWRSARGRVQQTLPSRSCCQIVSLSTDYTDYFFFEELFLVPFFEPFLEGTFAPASRASESPIAIACFLLVTFFPERPLFSVPFFRSCMAFSTFLPAFLLYLAISPHPPSIVLILTRYL